MIKVVTLFLIAMVVLAMFGRLRLPGRRKTSAPKKCRDCGGYILGSGPCKCKENRG